MEANYGEMKSVARCKVLRLVETYKKLEQARLTDPTLPKKPVYPEDIQLTKQTLTMESLVSTSDINTGAIKHLKRHREMVAADTEESAKESYDIYRKEGLRNQILSHSDPVSDKLREMIGRPPSPNSSSIKLQPRKPSDSKILKWKCNKVTHELTLLRSDGDVQHISMNDAYGLNDKDLEDLLSLELERDTL